MLVSADLPVGVDLVIEVDVCIPELASFSVVGEVGSFRKSVLASSSNNNWLTVNSLETGISAVFSVVGVAEVLVVLFAANVESLVENVGAEPVGVVTILGSGLGEDLREVLGVVLS